LRDTPPPSYLEAVELINKSRKTVTEETFIVTELRELDSGDVRVKIKTGEGKYIYADYIS